MMMNSFSCIVVVLLGFICQLSSATDCPSDTLDIAVNSTKIIFNSPDFPANYPRPLSCKWLFTAADDSVIKIRILTFDVYPSIFCLKDVLDIFDGNSKYSPVMQTWCGTKPAGLTYRTSTQYARLTFQSVTNGDSHPGFEFEVWSEINYIPKDGEAVLSPVHLTLLAVFVALFLVFFVFTIVILRKQWEKSRLRHSQF